ncbi:MAG: oligoendopeptidase F [Lentisphaeria bacterium]|nr:oligoendopeptidase F [Lentisphaeria bacterium]
MQELPKRSDLPVEQTWDLTPLYKTGAAWEKDFKKLRALVRDFNQYKGKLSDPQMLYEAFRASDKLSLAVEKLYTFAHLRSDEDTGNSENRARVDRISALSSEIGGETAWFEPELSALPEEQFKALLKAPVLKFYRRTLKEIGRDRKHTLSEAEERVLELSGDAFQTPEKTFSALNDADLVFPMIKDEKGKDIRLSHGNYIKMLESENRTVRHDAFKGIYSVYSMFKNTFASLMDAEVRNHVVDAKMRHYKSALCSSLSEDNIPESVYRSLISAVHENLEPLYEYFAFRAEKLGLKKLDMYDIHCPLVPNAARNVPWDEAVSMVKNALAPLGEEYVSVLDKAFRERWMDIPECKGKRSGAYSGGCYGKPPYLLLNHSGNLDSVFTLAHELGHSLHSYFSDRSNDYHYAGYKIFVAEVASTTNEILLQHYLLSKAETQAEKAYLVNYLIDTFRGTLYRQTMFAEFELMMHEHSAEGIPLTAEHLSNEYYKLNALYHGDAVEPDQDIRYEWARIPHFHYDFYVYKYATGISAAAALAQKILAGDTDGYFRFLKAGDSKDVIDIMKDAGVDFTTPEPINQALKLFADQVKQLKKLM